MAHQHHGFCFRREELLEPLIQWLEQFLVSKAKAVVLVSHDRAFIDNVTSRTIEISMGKIYDYAVNYSKFVALLSNT